MADVLSRIFGPANIASGTSTLFTGTASHIYTFKSIIVVNNSTGPITFNLGIGGVADANLVLPSLTLGAGEYAEFDGLFVMAGTETLQANASASGLTVSGHGLDQGGTPASQQLDYVTKTSNVSPTSSEADYIVGNSVTYDGSTRVKIELFVPVVEGGSSEGIIFRLYDGTTALCRLSDTRGASNFDTPVKAEIYLTPSAGAHTYKITAARAGTGTVTAYAGDGTSGSGAQPPAFMRISTDSGPINNAPGGTELVYAYTVTGSDKASIDTGVDAKDTGSGDWTNGDVLEVYLYSRTDEAVVFSQVNLTLNNDTGANYNLMNDGWINGSDSNNAPSLGDTKYSFHAPGSSCAASIYGTLSLTIPNFAGTVGYKQGYGLNTVLDTTAANCLMRNNELGYKSTSAITRLKVVPNTAAKNFKVGTQLLVYKRKRAN